MSIDPSAWQLTLQEQYTQSLHDGVLSQSLLVIALAQGLTCAEGTAALIPAQQKLPHTGAPEADHHAESSSLDKGWHVQDIRAAVGC